MGLANRTLLLALAGSSAMVLSASPASAAAVLGSTLCATTNVTPGAVSCGGWYQGNLNSGNATSLADEASIINGLLGTTYTGTTLPFVDLTSFAGSTITFAALTAPTVLGVHVGAANGAGGIGYDGTAFFLLNTGTSSVTLNVPGLSNARLFSVAAVPEASTWAMMLLGLGGIGFMLRRKRQAPARQGKTIVTFKGMARPA